ncbi:MAG: hypothetical protein JWQ71_4208 [Pedosphaera sp.]|nr:hypothetical protein [Pedosphaera sp.]
MFQYTNPCSKSKRSIIHAMIASLALLFLVGCRPDKDVTADPHYNFSSFTNTFWKTKTKTAIAGFKGHAPASQPQFILLPPDRFDPTDPNYIKIDFIGSIAAVLPSGTRLRITRLLQDQGNSGGVQVEAVVEDGTKAPKAVYLDRDFLANIRFASTGPTSNANWGVNPDMLEKP